MRIGRIFAGAALLVLPFVFSESSPDLREPKARFLIVLFGLWLGSELWRRIHPTLGCAMIFGALSAYFTATVFPIEQLFTLMAALGSCFWLGNASKNDIKHGLKLLELGGIACAIYAISQHFGWDPLLIHERDTPPLALFGQHTLYGPYAVACFASALFMRRHLCALFLFLPLPLIDSSFTYLSLGVVLAIYGLHRFGLRIMYAGVLLPIILFAASKTWPEKTATTLNDQGRLRVWQLSATLADRHPWIGHGLGSFRIVFPVFQDKKLRELNGIKDEEQSQEMRDLFREGGLIKQYWGIFLHPHNETMSAFFELGLVGILLAFWWLLAFFWDWIHLPDEPVFWALGAIFFAFLANAQGNFIFHLIPQALLPLWAFVAVTSHASKSILEADATYHS